MHKVQRPEKGHYTPVTSFRYAVECNEIDGFNYQVPVPIYKQCSKFIFFSSLILQCKSECVFMEEDPR